MTKDIWTAMGRYTFYVLFFIERHTRLCGPPPDADIELEDRVVCHSWLGGLLKHYQRAA